jgi:hypothetical protein
VEFRPAGAVIRILFQQFTGELIEEQEIAERCI